MLDLIYICLFTYTDKFALEYLHIHIKYVHSEYGYGSLFAQLNPILCTVSFSWHWALYSYMTLAVCLCCVYVYVCIIVHLYMGKDRVRTLIHYVLVPHLLGDPCYLKIKKMQVSACKQLTTLTRILLVIINIVLILKI